MTARRPRWRRPRRRPGPTVSPPLPGRPRRAEVLRLPEGPSPCSPSEGAELVRVQGAEAAVSLDGEREQQGSHRRLDDHVGQGEGCDHGIDHRPRGRDVGVDWRRRTLAIAHREQQHVGRGLHDRQADDEVDEVAAGDDPVEADQEEPCRDGVGEEAHRSPFRTRKRWSSSSPTITRIAPITSMPTDTLSSGTTPPETRLPVVPNPRKFSRNAPARMIPPTPISAKPAAPTPSAPSIALSGRIAARWRWLPAR